MVKILWLAPNFNHYKSRFLNHLSRDTDIDLDVLSGTGRVGFGDKELKTNKNFSYRQIPVSKKKFGFSFSVARALKTQFYSFDWVLIPVEKKIFPIFIYAIFLRFNSKLKGKKVKLISYNHLFLKSGNGKVKRIDRWLTKFFYNQLDRVIFYTENSCEKAINQNLIKPAIAYWANNTIDTLEVRKNYKFSYPPNNAKHIVFIGRLINSKKVDIAIKYFELLQQKMDSEQFVLDVIGDGPCVNIVKEASLKNNQIIWHGALVEESDIAKIMKNCSFVFLPGDSGLSINHAFAYGRPYVTFHSINHGPEISYIIENINGLVLDQNRLSLNLQLLLDLLTNKEKLYKFCDNAFEKSNEISLENWIKKIKYALLDG